VPDNLLKYLPGFQKDDSKYHRFLGLIGLGENIEDRTDER
jgi:hypothetical protein